MKTRLEGQAIALVASIASEPRVAPIVRTGNGATIEKPVSAIVSDDLLDSFASEIVACPVHASSALNSHFDGSDIKTIGSVTSAKVNRKKKQVEVEFVLWRSDYPDLVDKVKELFDSGQAAISWEILYGDSDIESVTENGKPAVRINNGVASGIAILKSTAAAFGKLTPVLALAGSEPESPCIGSLLHSHSLLHKKWDTMLAAGLSELLSKTLYDEHTALASMLADAGIVHAGTNSWLDNESYDFDKDYIDALSIETELEKTPSLKDLVTIYEVSPDAPAYERDGATFGVFGYIVRTGGTGEVLELVAVGDPFYGIKQPEFEGKLPNNSVFVVGEYFFPVDIWVLNGILLSAPLEERQAIAASTIHVAPTDYEGYNDYASVYSIASPFIIHYGPERHFGSMVAVEEPYSSAVAGTPSTPWVREVAGRCPASLQAHFSGFGDTDKMKEAFESGQFFGLHGINKVELNVLAIMHSDTKAPLSEAAFTKAYIEPSQDNVYEVGSVHLDLRIKVSNDEAIGWSIFAGVAFREIYTGELLIPAKPRLLSSMTAGAVPKDIEGVEAVDLGTKEPVPIGDLGYLVQLDTFDVIMLMQTPAMSEFYIDGSSVLENGRWMANLVNTGENVFLLRKVVSNTPYVIGKDKESFESTHEKIGKNYQTNVDNLQIVPDNEFNSKEAAVQWE